MIKRIKHMLITTAAATAILMSTSPALMAEIGTPSGVPVLTVSGAITPPTSVTPTQFDLEMLLAMEATEFTTSTIWTDGPLVFTGVSVATLVDQIGGKGNILRATAINDYAVEIELNDASTQGAIIAYHQNGEPMSVRDKGPLWIVYPFDESPEYRTEVVYARSIWQLDRIEILD